MARIKIIYILYVRNARNICVSECQMTWERYQGKKTYLENLSSFKASIIKVREGTKNYPDYWCNAPTNDQLTVECIVRTSSDIHEAMCPGTPLFTSHVL